MLNRRALLEIRRLATGAFFAGSVAAIIGLFLGALPLTGLKDEARFFVYSSCFFLGMVVSALCALRIITKD